MPAWEAWIAVPPPLLWCVPVISLSVMRGTPRSISIPLLSPEIRFAETVGVTVVGVLTAIAVCESVGSGR